MTKAAAIHRKLTECEIRQRKVCAKVVDSGGDSAARIGLRISQSTISQSTISQSIIRLPTIKLRLISSLAIVRTRAT